MIMKGKVMPAFEALAKDELQQLTAETKETIATVKETQPKSFGSVDMWNRQRQMKQASGFLRKWQLN